MSHRLLTCKYYILDKIVTSFNVVISNFNLNLHKLNGIVAVLGEMTKIMRSIVIKGNSRKHSFSLNLRRNMSQRKLTISSLNARGLSNQSKRREVFQWPKRKKFSVFFLQEAYCTKETENIWRAEWGYGAIFSSYCSESAGVLHFI